MANLPQRIRIATRESRLALAQTGMVAAALRARYPQLAVELVPMTTKGDRVLDRPLAQVGGKGLFVKELESALDEDRADIAVHSMKDVPMVLPPQFAVATFGAREVPQDAFVSNRFETLAALPRGARVGTSSLRRECQLRRARPDLELVALRGNVNTRLAKLDAGDYDAIVLAAAGLRRLGLEARIRSILEGSIPAIAQGILAIEFHRARADLAAALAPFEHADTACAARAERALGLVVEGSCEVPLGALAAVEGGTIRLEAFLGLPDGTRFVHERIEGEAARAEALGTELGSRILRAGGREILDLLAPATQRLDGMGVVITRPREPAEALARALARAGARPIVFPALAIEELAPTPALEASLALLPRAALAIFVSAHAVECGLAAARARGPWPEGLAVAAVGEATAQALRNSGFARVISPPERHDSDALLALPQLQSVSGADIVIFRGEGGRERLKEGLEARGARVTYAECYRRVRPASDPAALLAAWDRGEVHAVSALSGETLENFVAMLGEGAGERLGTVALVVPHEAVAAHREARRFARVLVAPLGTEGLASTLARIRTTQ